MPNLSRRHLVTTAAALPALAVLPAAAAANPAAAADAQLIALGDQFDHLIDRMNDSFRRSSIALDEVEKMVIPDSLRPKADDRRCGLSRPISVNVGDGLYGHNDIPNLRRIDHPRAREIVRDYKRWLKSRNVAYEQSGYNEIKREQDALHIELLPIEAAIISAPATTLEGMKVKARVVYWCCQGEVDVDPTDATDSRVSASIIRDLMQLQGQLPMDNHSYHAKFVMREAVQS